MQSHTKETKKRRFNVNQVSSCQSTHVRQEEPFLKQPCMHSGLGGSGSLTLLGRLLASQCTRRTVCMPCLSLNSWLLHAFACSSLEAQARSHSLGRLPVRLPPLGPLREHRPARAATSAQTDHLQMSACASMRECVRALEHVSAHACMALPPVRSASCPQIGAQESTKKDIWKLLGQHSAFWIPGKTDASDSSVHHHNHRPIHFQAKIQQSFVTHLPDH